MKAGKGISTLLLSLYCVLLLNACSYFGGGDSATPTPSPSNMTVAEAEAKLRQAEEKLAHLKAAAEAKAVPPEIQGLQTRSANLRKAANDSKKHADTLRQQTLDSGKNPDDSIGSPKTYQAAQDAKVAAAAADEAEKEFADAKSGGAVSPDVLAKAQQAITQASKDLEDAKLRTQAAIALSPSPSTQASRPAEGSETSIVTSLLPFLLTTLPLLVVMGLLYRRTIRRLKKTAGILSEKLSELNAEQVNLAGNVRSMIVKSLKESPEFSSLGTKLERIDATLNEIHGVVADQSSDQGGKTSDARVEVEAEEERPIFPMSAEDYLDRMQGKLVYVKHDYPNNTLIRDSENSEFALVLDHSPSGMHFVVPKLSRFPTKQDYYTVYHVYFECNPPFSGTVTIIKPALVDAVEGGWQLNQKGQLKVG
jgi:hypothetical protein